MASGTRGAFKEEMAVCRTGGGIQVDVKACLCAQRAHQRESGGRELMKCLKEIHRKDCEPAKGTERKERRWVSAEKGDRFLFISRAILSAK